MKVSSPIPHKRARIEIIPLIDIMFFLLASFMMVSLSQTHMKGIRVNLPSPVSIPQPPDPTVVQVQVLSGNATYINRQFVPDDQVLPRLFELHKARWRCTATSSRCSIAFARLELRRSVIRLKLLQALWARLRLHLLHPRARLRRQLRRTSLR